MPPKSDKPNTKFDAEARAVYLEELRSGNMKMASAEVAGVSYRTVERRRADDDGFKDDERLAMMYALEGKEKVLSRMADEGDLGAMKMWLHAHGKSTYNDNKTVTLDATPAAVEMSQNDALAAVAEMQTELAYRHARLLESGDIIDVEEVLPDDDIPELSPVDDKFRI